MIIISEPLHEKTNNLGFQPGPTHTGLYSHRRQLEAGNFGHKKSTNHVAKPKALISCAVTAQLIYAFVFAYADCWFSDVAAKIYAGKQSKEAQGNNELSTARAQVMS